MNLRRTSSLVGAGLTVLLFGVCPSSGDTSAAIVEFQLGPGRPLPGTDTIPAFADGGSTLGWSFTITQASQVHALGFYDAGGDGLAVSHLVGLWTSGGVLLASAVVPAGDSGQLVGEYRYATIAPVALQPGLEYVIGAAVPLGSWKTSYSEPLQFDSYPYYNVEPASVVVDPTVSLVSDALAWYGNAGLAESLGPGELTFPDAITPGEYFYAGNLLIGTIPEPSSAFLLISVFVACFFRRPHGAG